MLPSDRHSEPVPIWMAALLASGCEATGAAGPRRVDWRCVSGRAVYTNTGYETEVIHPFGVPVQHGETVVVSWRPNETSYTVELARAAA
jgi:hypothetical protein